MDNIFKLSSWGNSRAAVDLDTMPVVMIGKGLRIAGGFAIFCGGGFGLLPVVALTMALVTDERGKGSDLALSAIVGVIVLALMTPLILWGVNQFVERRTITVGFGEVQSAARTLFSSSSWREPIERFAGIAPYSTWESKDGSCYYLELTHDDASKRVRLFKTQYDEKLPERWAYCCDRLGRPAVQEINPRTRVTRPRGTLDRPLLELLRSGQVALPPLPGNVPDGVEVRADAAGVSVGVRGSGRVVCGAAGVVIDPGGGAVPGPAIAYEAVESITFASVRAASSIANPLGAELRVAGWKLKKPSLTITSGGAGQAGHRRRESRSLGRGLGVEALVWLQIALLRLVASRGDGRLSGVLEQKPLSDQ